MRKLLTKLILGKKKDYFNIVRINNELYEVRIQPYISAEELINRAISSGVLTAQGKFARQVDS